MLASVAKHGCLDPDYGQKLFDSIDGAPLLPESQEAAHENDEKNNSGIDMIFQEERQRGGKNKGQDNGALELGK